jgi:acyl-phosphate glycerol 3-phosphate acyltransferase
VIIIATIVSFLCGSLMFSYWIGRLLKLDIRQIGDGNPGAANLWSGAGYKYGLLGVALDFLKGYIPVLLIVNSGILTDEELIPVVLAPVVGHAFSPFMKFNGGKAVAVSFGVWSALTQFRVTLIYAIILAILLIVTRMIKGGEKSTSAEDGLQTTMGFLLLSVYLLYAGYPMYTRWIWLGNFLILVWKNREDLAQLIKDKVRSFFAS